MAVAAAAQKQGEADRGGGCKARQWMHGVVSLVDESVV